MYTLYKLQSTATEKIYIGCTSKSLHTRFKHHISQFNSPTSRIVLYPQLKELGLDILDFTIKEVCQIEDRDKAFRKEQTLIKEHRNTCGVFNNDFSANHWALGTKGVLKPNSGSFKKGRGASETSFKKGNKAWNKGKVGLQEGSCIGTITVHKDDKNKRIGPSELDEYLANGYVKGMKPRKQAKGYRQIPNGKFEVIYKGNYIGQYATEDEAKEVRRKLLLQ